jgi:hypothetical protein
LISGLLDSKATTFKSWLYVSFHKHFTPILEYHSDITRKYETENGPVLSKKPSIAELQKVVLGG